MFKQVNSSKESFVTNRHLLIVFVPVGFEGDERASYSYQIKHSKAQRFDIF